MFLNKPKIRTKTVVVKKNPAQTPSSAAAPPPQRPAPAQRASTNGPPADRYRLTPAQSRAKDVAPRRSRTVPLSNKRKPTPSTPQCASSDDSSAEEEGRAGSKRRRTRPASSSIEPMQLNRTLEVDMQRRIRARSPGGPAETDGETDGGTNGDTNGGTNGDTNGSHDDPGTLIHGQDMTLGAHAKEYKPAFPGHEPITLELQYPSTSPPERFSAVDPLDLAEGYSPLADIYFTIEETIAHYLPPHLSTPLSSDTEGTVRLLKRAVSKNSPADFRAELESYNKLIAARVADGTIPAILDTTHALPLSLVKRITAQSYTRIVSPHAHRLRKVTGKETTYGELLPPFIHKIFAHTHLNSSHIFVDLGSGVANVVLQAALQTGAQAWGIEKMDLAADLAAQQAAELTARARTWNIAFAAPHLLHGDFLCSPAIDAILPRADVVLVNNKVFGETLNNALLQKFLDLKVGCQVVSLESFGFGKRGGRNEQAIAGLFEERRFESGTGCVSWAGESVGWFLGVKVR